MNIEQRSFFTECRGRDGESHDVSVVFDEWEYSNDHSEYSNDGFMLDDADVTYDGLVRALGKVATDALIQQAHDEGR